MVVTIDGAVAELIAEFLSMVVAKAGVVVMGCGDRCVLCSGRLWLW